MTDFRIDSENWIVLGKDSKRSFSCLRLVSPLQVSLRPSLREDVVPKPRIGTCSIQTDFEQLAKYLAMLGHYDIRSLCQATSAPSEPRVGLLSPSMPLPSPSLKRTPGSTFASSGGRPLSLPEKISLGNQSRERMLQHIHKGVMPTQCNTILLAQLAHCSADNGTLLFCQENG